MLERVLDYAKEKYGSLPEHLWAKFPDDYILRHSENKKWYAVFMTVSREKLGLNGTDKVQVIDLKSDPMLIGSLTLKDGILPGYHMNKSKWITVLLDGSVDIQTVFDLIDMSYTITIGKPKSKRKRDA